MNLSSGINQYELWNRGIMMTSKDEYENTLNQFLGYLMQNNQEKASELRQKLRELGIQLMENNEKVDRK